MDSLVAERRAGGAWCSNRQARSSNLVCFVYRVKASVLGASARTDARIRLIFTD